ncbi:MAG: hypothetical protein K2X11_10925 [Acetobacteraceae bacterium]|nr:hypothetical protein [Acetobacteraceae bacterium]
MRRALPFFLAALLTGPGMAKAQSAEVQPVCSGRIEMRELRAHPAEEGMPRRMLVELANVSAETLVVQPVVRAAREPVFAAPVVLRREQRALVSLPVGDELPVLLTPTALRAVIGASCRIG